MLQKNLVAFKGEDYEENFNSYNEFSARIHTRFFNWL